MDPLKDLEEVEPGRVAILHLRGPKGNLDVVCVYLDAGPPHARIASMRKLGGCLASKDAVLSIVVGDFNFVNDAQGRWSSSNSNWATNGDLREAEHLEQYVLKPFGLCEWEQPHFTCLAKGVWSRLDRTYTNQHVSHQLDTCCKAYVKPWCKIGSQNEIQEAEANGATSQPPDLEDKMASTHRPIGISRCSASHTSKAAPPKAIWPYKHKHFSERVNVEY